MGLVVHVHHVFDRELGVTLSGSETLMAEQLLDRAQVRALFQHVGAESMPKGVRVDIG